MKIKWIGPQRRVARLELVSKGHIIDTQAGYLREVDARNLVRQGLAKEYRPGRRSAEKE